MVGNASLHKELEVKFEMLVKEKLELEEKVTFLETKAVADGELEVLKNLLSEAKRTADEVICAL